MIPTVLWLLFDFLSLKNYVSVPSKSYNQKNLLIKYGSFLLASWRSMTKIARSGSLRDMDPRIRTHTKMSWIRGSEPTPKCHGSALWYLQLSFTFVWNPYGSRSADSRCGSRSADSRCGSGSGKLMPIRKDLAPQQCTTTATFGGHWNQTETCWSMPCLALAIIHYYRLMFKFGVFIKVSWLYPKL